MPPACATTKHNIMSNTFNIGYKYNVEYYRDITACFEGEGKEKKLVIKKKGGGKPTHLKEFNDSFTKNNEFKYYKKLSDDCLGLDNLADSFALTATYPGLVLGTGYEHELKTDEAFKLGFFFDYTTGLPVIPGSSVKGLLRSMFPGGSEEKAAAKIELIRALLGSIGVEGAENMDVGKLEKEIFEGYRNDKDKPEKHLSPHKWDIFHDAYIESSKHTGGTFLGDDYITPHKEALKNPIPLKFLKVLPNVTFRFQFDVKNGSITRKQKLQLFHAILTMVGAGAKTNVGYGQFAESTFDPEAKGIRKETDQEKHEAQQAANPSPQPVTPSTHQPVNPSTRQFVNPSTRQFVNPSTRYSSPSNSPSATTNSVNSEVRCRSLPDGKTSTSTTTSTPDARPDKPPSSNIERWTAGRASMPLARG